MRRAVAKMAEIVGRGDEPGAEEPLPDAIHVHACGERIAQDRRANLGQFPAGR